MAAGPLCLVTCLAQAGALTCSITEVVAAPSLGRAGQKEASRDSGREQATLCSVMGLMDRRSSLPGSRAVALPLQDRGNLNSSSQAVRSLPDTCSSDPHSSPQGGYGTSYRVRGAEYKVQI